VRQQEIRKQDRELLDVWQPGPYVALLTLLRAVAASCLLAVLYSLSV
jgi:hypothetical protein